MPKRRKRLLVEIDGVPVSEVAAGFGPGPTQERRGLAPDFSTESVLGEPFDLLGDPVIGKTLHHLHDLRVKCSPALLEKTGIRYFMGECVRERVFQLWEKARLIQKFGGLELREPRANLIRRETGDRVEQIERHVFADDGGDLQEQLAAHRQAVDTRGQDRLHRGRDLYHLERLGEPVGTLLADENVRLGQGSYAFFEEEGITLRTVGQKLLERAQTGLVSQKHPQELVGCLGCQRIYPDLSVIAAAAPAVLVLRAIVDDEKDPRRGEALDQRVQDRLRLGVDPVQVLEDQQQGLDPALAHDQPPNRVQSAMPPFGRIQPEKRACVRKCPQQREHRRSRLFEESVEAKHPGRDFVVYRAPVIAILDREELLEQISYGTIGCRSPVRHGPAFEHKPSRQYIRPGELPNQSRLPHARLPNRCDDLTVTERGILCGSLQNIDLTLASDEPAQPADAGRLEPRLRELRTE